jgi:hypothetical protein
MKYSSTTTPSISEGMDLMKQRAPHGVTAWQRVTTEVVDGLFVGEIASRADRAALARHRIDTVVSILAGDDIERVERLTGRKFPVPPMVTHFWYEYGDHDEIAPEDLHRIVTRFGARTLVHCVSGSNRSTCVAIARLIYLGMSPVRACTTYYHTRGKTIAAAYGDRPRMYPAMIHNLDNYAAWAEAQR